MHSMCRSLSTQSKASLRLLHSNCFFKHSQGIRIAGVGLPASFQEASGGKECSQNRVHCLKGHGGLRLGAQDIVGDVMSGSNLDLDCVIRSE